MASQFFRAIALIAISLTLSIAPRTLAQAATAQPSAAAPAAQDKPPLSQEELDQMIAPLALYPDSLLSQIFMASTYPVEIVQAERWMKANSKLKDAALTAALEKETWDPSVKSLVAFPDVLTMMSEKLDMTIKLGDAFIGQQKQVMDTVQKLRAKAKETGNLKSSEQQTVTVEPAAAGSSTQTIIIQPTNPQVVYVPQYNPTVVYGTWPYPAYPPYPYYPPNYVASSVVSFGVGLAVGAAWGYAWGNCNWGGGNVDIDVNRNTNINNNINRSNYQNNFQGGSGNRQGGQGTWQHDSAHRQGAPYRDSKTAQQFGGKSGTQAAQARDSYRGRAEAGQKDIARGGADQFKGTGAGAGAGAGAGNRPSTGGPGTGAGGARANTPSSPSAGNRATTNGGKSSAVSGSNKSGSAARADSSRGSASRSSSSSPSRSSSSPSRSSGGGASRSGGGGGGGRGGGGRR